MIPLCKVGINIVKRPKVENWYKHGQLCMRTDLPGRHKTIVWRNWSPCQRRQKTWNLHRQRDTIFVVLSACTLQVSSYNIHNAQPGGTYYIVTMYLQIKVSSIRQSSEGSYSYNIQNVRQYYRRLQSSDLKAFAIFPGRGSFTLISRQWSI